jgi:aspartyl-tRNA(Asn)/glutamyl-tRNA(Gln) amidotransferase subunit B
MNKKFTTDVVIGLEIHIELATDSKLFCGCATHGSEEPNSRTCEICLGHPGSKPVLNKKAVEYAIKLALATNSKIASELIFSRKSYFYPDMSKNYQISQYELPLAIEGKIKLSSGKEIGLTRIHMEEDPAALIHPNGMQNSSIVLVDYNRSGDPLVEVVTEPELESPNEARDFMKQLITILGYLNIFDVNRCIIKADANISIKESDYTRVEIKNITGFKDIEDALKYEVARQKDNIKEVIQETRAWDSDKRITFSLRKKEVEEEYGYIIDPDLVKIDLSSDWIEEIKKNIPELAHEKQKKYEEKYGKMQSVSVLLKDPKIAKFFEEVVSQGIEEKLAAHWIAIELHKILNRSKKTIEKSNIKPKHMVDIINLIESKKITKEIGVKIFDMLDEKTFDVKEYVEKNGLTIVQDEEKIKELAEKTVKDNQDCVGRYKAGNEASIHYLVGQVMKATKGRADPYLVNKIIKKLIE